MSLFPDALLNITLTLSASKPAHVMFLDSNYAIDKRPTVACVTAWIDMRSGNQKNNEKIIKKVK
jgi:hypothetical protein